MYSYLSKRFHDIGKEYEMFFNAIVSTIDHSAASIQSVSVINLIQNEMLNIICIFLSDSDHLIIATD